MTAAEKRAETYRMKREREENRKNDRKRAIEIARQIRDSVNATDADRLDAVRILMTLTT